MKLPLTLCAALAATMFCQAQPTDTRTPSQIYWEKQSRQYNEDYLRLNNSTPNKPSSGKAGVNAEAVRQLADQWKRNKGQVPESDAEYNRLKALAAKQNARERAAAAEYQRQLDQQEAERVRYAMQLQQEAQKKAQAIKALQVKIREECLEAGLELPEAVMLALNGGGSMNMYDDVNARYLRDVEKIKQSFNLFQKEKTTASFDRLMSLARDFEIISFSATKAYRFIAERYPENYLAADHRLIEVLFYFYGGNKRLDSYYENQFASDAQKRSMDSLFLQLVDRHGYKALEACRSENSGFVPVYKWFSEARNANRMVEASYWADMGLHIPFEGYYWNNEARPYLEYLKQQPGYFTNQPDIFWRELGKSIKGGSVAAITNVFNIDYSPLIMLNKGKIEHDFNKEFFKTWSPVIQSLADSGDASALNTWAVWVITGNVRKADRQMAIGLWQKAAGESMPAVANLFTVLRSDVGGSLSFDEASKPVKNVIDQSTKATKKTMYYLEDILKSQQKDDLTYERNTLARLSNEVAVQRGFFKFE